MKLIVKSVLPNLSLTRNIEAQQEMDYYLSMGVQPPHKAVRKTRKQDHKGGIDWFIYHERILNPLLFHLQHQKSGSYLESWLSRIMSPHIKIIIMYSPEQI